MTKPTHTLCIVVDKDRVIVLDEAKEELLPTIYFTKIQLKQFNFNVLLFSNSSMKLMFLIYPNFVENIPNESSDFLHDTSFSFHSAR